MPAGHNVRRARLTPRRLGSLSLVALASLACETRPEAAPLTGARAADKLLLGEQLDPAQWPASLQLGRCSATLIGPRVVLTAAHCASRQQFRELRERRGLVVKACEKAGRSSRAPDLALALLDADAPLEPAERLEQRKGREPRLNDSLYLTGCGYTETGGRGLRGAWAKVIELADEPGECVRIRLIGAAVTPGDSGGAVYDSDGPHRRLVGVVVKSGPRPGEACFESLLATEARALLSRFESKYGQQGAALCGRSRGLAAKICR
ncbi:MAG TPA: trypsin-like serine protease [Thermoanaerobaculia bacterium]|nr:trypsin-like serine protease [Thermoanaerobaculia bacterium]